jgi:Family of unknown function (DUF5681)
MPFQPGHSGNPAGRPPGARNKVNRAMEPVFQASGEAIIERLVEHAKAANPVALRLCVDRLVPLGKHRQVGFQLPPMEKGDDVRAAIATIHDALGDGDISSGEAADLLRVAEISARMLREADAPANGLASQLARHEQALAHVAEMLGCDPSVLLGPAEQQEDVTAVEEAPPIVNNNAETMAEAAMGAVEPAAAEPDAAPAAPADAAEGQAGAGRETEAPIVNNNAETMAAAMGAGEPPAADPDAGPAAPADAAEGQAGAGRETEAPIVNNNAETMAPDAFAPSPLVGSNENLPGGLDEPLRAASG